MRWEIIVFILCIVLSALFSGIETAFTSLSIMKVKFLEDRKGQRGKIIANMLRRPEILLTTILFSNTLVNLTASALVTKVTIELFSGRGVNVNAVTTVSTLILALVLLIFGEATPKRLAFVFNEFIALHTARFVFILSWVLRPFIFFVSIFSNVVTKFARLFSRNKDPGMTLEGILHMVHLAETMGVVETHETQMVKNVFRFNDVPLRSAMTHRTNVFSLPSAETIKGSLDRIIESGFSRIPLYDKHPENIVGVVLAKEIMKRVAKGETGAALSTLALTPLYVPETKTVNEMFSEFKKQKVNMAIVLDEYGGLAGIVTMEDVIEEILGELYDENEERKTEKIILLKENTYRIEGDAPLYLVQEKLGLTFPEEIESQTFGGFVVETLGHIPQRNEVGTIEQGRIIVEAVKKNRILSVRLVLKKADEENGRTGS